MMRAEGEVSKTATNLVDVFVAAVLVYIVAGSITGSILAVHQDKLICWPTAIFYSVLTACDDPIQQQFWTYAVGLPTEFLNGPVRALLIATSSYENDASDVGMIALRSITLGGVITYGLPFIYERSRSAAWLIVALMIGEIVYLRTLVPDIANWLWAT